MKKDKTPSTGMKENKAYHGWLLFFYRVPTKPVNSRMKIWRKLNKSGALHLRGLAYVLPSDEDHYEFFVWLSSEVSSLGGEAALIKADRIENIKDEDLINMFNHQRENDYDSLVKSVHDLERKVNSVRKGSRLPDVAGLKSQFSKCLRDYQNIRNLDFFTSAAGVALHDQLQTLHENIETITPKEALESKIRIVKRNINDFKGKIWITRPNPFVDRMASAWLIRKYIDAGARFDFMGEERLSELKDDMISYDVRNGNFTHVGDMCTFEVMRAAFDLKDKKLKKIAEIVHDLDMKDDRFSSPEAKGLEDILTGIRRSVDNDSEALEKGMSIFEMFYTALT